MSTNAGRDNAIKILDEFGNPTSEGLVAYNAGILGPTAMSLIEKAKASKSIRTILIVLGLLLAAFLIYWFLIRK